MNNILTTALTALIAPLTAGTAFSFLMRSGSEKHTPGLLFHSIVPKTGPGMSVLSVKRFEAFLDLLQKNGKQAKTLSQHFSENSTADQETVVLTFDDGLEDFYLYAFPLLEQRGMKVTLFPIAEFLGKKTTWDVINCSKQHCTEHMIKKISEAGHEIGSHSLTHLNLPWLDDRRLRFELKESKQRLEDITRKEISSISFPFGSWDQRVWEFAKETGYRFATLYRGHQKSQKGHLPVYGVYRFDSPLDIYSRAFPKSKWSISRAQAKLMTHFSKGSPVWKFRKEYTVF